MGTSAVESSGSVKFDDQTFLISYFSEINQRDYESKSYTNTFRLNNTPELPMCQMIGIFNGTANLSPFLKLNTHQYSALVPKVKLYRLDYDKEGNKLSDKEFIFDKDYKFEITDILNFPKRSNSGIKRINWRLAGSNPVTAEKQVEVEIELYFDSINSFSSGDFDSMRNAWTNALQGITSTSFNSFNNFGSLDTEKTTRNYWSLLFHPKIEQNDSIPQSRERYNTNFFRIRANVGWEEVESNVKNQLFPDLDINEEIKKLNYSFLLNLVEHKFNFNEDGSLSITATYLAQFENSTHNYNFNLLGGLKEELDNAKNIKIGTLIKETLKFEAGKGGIITVAEKESLLENLSLGLGFSELDPANIINELGFNLSDEEKQNLAKQLSELSLSDIDEISKILNNKEAQECLNNDSLQVTSQQTLNQQFNPNNGPLDIVNKDLSTIVDRANKLIERNSKRKKEYYYKQLFDELIEKKNIKTIQIDKKIKEQWDIFASTNGATPKPNFTNAISVNILNPIEEQERILERYKPWQAEGAQTAARILSEAAVKFDTDTKIISYVTVGDIIDSAFEIIKLNFGNNINEIKRQNIVCGNISNNSKILEISNPDNQIPTNRNILDIPIDLKLLKLFLIENVVKPQKEVYSLFSFIKDLITKLVTGALNGSNLYNSETEAYSDVSLATTVFSFGNSSAPDNPLGRLLDYTDPIDFQLQANFYYINNVNIHTDYYTYLLIYDKKFIDFYPNNDTVKDEKIGIYHYTVGQDFGLLKSANFSRIDTPYLKEAKAVGKKTFYLGQFRDRYNVSLTMVGNNIYYPGMMLYIQPSAEAVQSVDKNNPEANPSFSQITGIGGYYFVEKVDSTISEEGYETKLDCIWQYDGSEQPEETVNDLSKCNTVFSKSQTLNIFLSLFTKAENQSQKQKEEEALENAEGVRSSLPIVTSGVGLAVTLFGSE
jgi:hypothetical protein